MQTKIVVIALGIFLLIAAIWPFQALFIARLTRYLPQTPALPVNVAPGIATPTPTIDPESLAYDEPKTAMDYSMADMIENMQKLQGDRFDREYLKMMIGHHQGAVDMAQMAIERTKRDDIRKMAQDIISTQTREIEMMQQWERLFWPQPTKATMGGELQ